MFSYFAYGLNICTVMPLPELVEGKATEEQVIIRFGRVDRPSSEIAERGWGYSSPAPEEDYLFWQEAGAFLVRGGHEIVVDPTPGVDERMLRLFILGPVLSVLLHQRGYLLLHASAVAVADEAILFLGGSGWGKSTIAGALHARGHRLVTDDVAVLRVEESFPMVFPSFPQLKLWPEAAISLGDDPVKLPRWNPHSEKRARPADYGFSLAPIRLKRIYVLDGGNAPEIVPLRLQEALVELVRHTYGSDYDLQTLMRVGTASHFLQCTRLVKNVSMRTLRRQKSLSQLPYLARSIEEDLAQSPEHGVLSAC